MWTWSEPHQDYYTASYDANGQVVYMWAKQQSAAPVAQSSFANDGQRDRDSAVSSLSVAEQQTHSRFSSLSDATGAGWGLDSTYYMRLKYEAYAFWKPGRVFSMLYTEPAGDNKARYISDDAYTIVRFGETVYSQIRRFVVVSVRRHFVYALAIMTYSGQGCLKSGVNPSEHAVIHLSGAQPRYLHGELEKGLIPDPIEVTPADINSVMKPESRVRFGKVYPIEWNVKVKDIGMVVERDMSTLVAHYKQENH